MLRKIKIKINDLKITEQYNLSLLLYDMILSEIRMRLRHKNKVDMMFPEVKAFQNIIFVL